MFHATVMGYPIWFPHNLDQPLLGVAKRDHTSAHCRRKKIARYSSLVLEPALPAPRHQEHFGLIASQGAGLRILAVDIRQPACADRRRCRFIKSSIYPALSGLLAMRHKTLASLAMNILRIGLLGTVDGFCGTRGLPLHGNGRRLGWNSGFNCGCSRFGRRFCRRRRLRHNRGRQQSGSDCQQGQFGLHAYTSSRDCRSDLR